MQHECWECRGSWSQQTVAQQAPGLVFAIPSCPNCGQPASGAIGLELTDIDDLDVLIDAFGQAAIDRRPDAEGGVFYSGFGRTLTPAELDVLVLAYRHVIVLGEALLEPLTAERAMRYGEEGWLSVLWIDPVDSLATGVRPWLDPRALTVNLATSTIGPPPNDQYGSFLDYEIPFPQVLDGRCDIYLGEERGHRFRLILETLVQCEAARFLNSSRWYDWVRQTLDTEDPYGAQGPGRSAASIRAQVYVDELLGTSMGAMAVFGSSPVVRDFSAHRLLLDAADGPQFEAIEATTRWWERTFRFPELRPEDVIELRRSGANEDFVDVAAQAAARSATGVDEAVELINEAVGRRFTTTRRLRSTATEIGMYSIQGAASTAGALVGGDGGAALAGLSTVLPPSILLLLRQRRRAHWSTQLLARIPDDTQTTRR